MTTQNKFVKTHDIIQFDVKFSSADRVYTLPYIHPVFINRIIAIHTLSVQFLKRIKIDEFDELTFQHKFRDQDGNILTRQKPLIPSYGYEIDEQILTNGKTSYIDAEYYITYLINNIKTILTNFDETVETNRLLKQRRLEIIDIRKEFIKRITDTILKDSVIND